MYKVVKKNFQNHFPLCGMAMLLLRMLHDPKSQEFIWKVWKSCILHSLHSNSIDQCIQLCPDVKMKRTMKHKLNVNLLC
jgi:hypothetical protein